MVDHAIKKLTQSYHYENRSGFGHWGLRIGFYFFVQELRPDPGHQKKRQRRAGVVRVMQSRGLLARFQQLPVFFVNQNGITQILMETAFGNVFSSREYSFVGAQGFVQ